MLGLGRSGWIVLSAFYLAACGRGGGDSGAGAEVVPPATPLSNAQATEAATSAATSLVAALSALVLDVPGLPAAAAGGERRRGAARSALQMALLASARVGATRCAGGGSIQATCNEDGGVSTLVTRAEECGTIDEQHGLSVLTNGELRVRVQARGVCGSGEVPPGVTRTLRYRHFRVTIRDGPRLLETFAAPVLAQRIEPTGSGCADVGRMTVDGRVLVTRADGVDVTLDADTLTLLLSAESPPCVQHVEATGRLDVFDHTSGRQLDSSLHGLRVAFALEPTPVSAALDGAATLDCVGAVVYASEAPLIGNGPCASGGTLRLTLPSGARARSLIGAGGGVDFDYDGDGTPDRSVASCLDPSLAACR
jgi:hypothetical protein